MIVKDMKEHRSSAEIVMSRKSKGPHENKSQFSSNARKQKYDKSYWYGLEDVLNDSNKQFATDEALLLGKNDVIDKHGMSIPCYN